MAFQNETIQALEQVKPGPGVFGVPDRASGYRVRGLLSACATLLLKCRHRCSFTISGQHWPLFTLCLLLQVVLLTQMEAASATWTRQVLMSFCFTCNNETFGASFNLCDKVTEIHKRTITPITNLNHNQTDKFNYYPMNDKVLCGSRA